jgi:hypothetical protein
LARRLASILGGSRLGPIRTLSIEDVVDPCLGALTPSSVAMLARGLGLGHGCGQVRAAIRRQRPGPRQAINQTGPTSGPLPDQSVHLRVARSHADIVAPRSVDST